MDPKNIEHVLKAYLYYLKMCTHCCADEITARFILDNWEKDYETIERCI